jgi:hypothetical protein
MFAKVYRYLIVKAGFIHLFDILPKKIVSNPSIRPDIRYPAYSIRCIPNPDPGAKKPADPARDPENEGHFSHMEQKKTENN